VTRVAVLAVSAVLVAGCATSKPVATTTPDGATPPAPTTAGPTPTTSRPDAALPPHTTEALVEILGPLVEGLGFEVSRASLVDLTTYRASPQGTHLAVYVTPRQPLDADGHARSFLPVAAAFLPTVFERWPALESFDVCQEPYAWPGGGIPPSVTLIDVRRDAAAVIDWTTVTLAELISRASVDPDLIVTADGDVTASATWSTASG
jgi:hypothetical protein